ncbi:MAG: hypothetical protein DVB22_003228 [Verrucomicrobia bacterium]|nr:MAG: hypothetical protein DVB22_003228 [Verrucomicrobiota bacterium]
MVPANPGLWDAIPLGLGGGQGWRRGRVEVIVRCALIRGAVDVASPRRRQGRDGLATLGWRGLESGGVALLNHRLQAGTPAGVRIGWGVVSGGVARAELNRLGCVLAPRWDAGIYDRGIPGPSRCFVPGLGSWGPLGRKGGVWGDEGIWSWRRLWLGLGDCFEGDPG